MLTTKSRILVAGARGLVGSAIVRSLKRQGYQYLLTPTSTELNCTDQSEVFRYLREQKPEYVFVAAAKVGGIWVNANYPAEFAYTNLMIESNLIHGSYVSGVKKLLFLGSSCIYPKDSTIPIKESSLLTGPLEPTNEAYAIAKIAGIKLCDYYREQYGCDFISVMPTNTFGPHDNFDLKTGHMLPSLMHKMHLAKLRSEKKVSVWGTGNPLREMIYVDDIADGLLFLMNNYSQAGVINLGTGEDLSVKEIAETVKKIVGFEGELEFDLTKPDGVFRKVMDVSRVKGMGWKATVSFEEGVEKSYQWFVDHYEELTTHPAYKKKPLIFSSNNLSTKMKLFLINPDLLNKSLDDPQVTVIHHRIIQSKPFLKKVYLYHYKPFLKSEKKLEKMKGLSIELGSGGGFLKNLLPQVITTDVRLFPNVDQIENAYQMTFKEGELKAIYMTGVLHHMGNVREFFREARRCLSKDGVIIMMEPHMSWFGWFFFKFLHHEACDLNTRQWEFPQVGHLSDANTALPFLIFDRDFDQFKKEFPEFEVQTRTYHTFLLYAFSGGIFSRISPPGFLFAPLAFLEKLLKPWMKKYLGTMQTITLIKR